MRGRRQIKIHVAATRIDLSDEVYHRGDFRKIDMLTHDGVATEIAFSNPYVGKARFLSTELVLVKRWP